MSFLRLNCSLQRRRPLGPLLGRISEKYPGSTWQTETTSKADATHPRGTRCAPAVQGSTPRRAAPPAAASPGPQGARQVLPATHPGPAARPGCTSETVPSRHTPGTRKPPDAEDTKGQTCGETHNAPQAPPAPHARCPRLLSGTPGGTPAEPRDAAHPPAPLGATGVDTRVKRKVGLVDMTFYGSARPSVEKTAGRRGSGRRRHSDTRPGLRVASPGPSRCPKLPAARPPPPARRPKRPRRRGRQRPEQARPRFHFCPRRPRRPAPREAGRPRAQARAGVSARTAGRRASPAFSILPDMSGLRRRPRPPLIGPGPGRCGAPGRRGRR